MKFAKLPAGDKWHLFVDGRIVCKVPFDRDTVIISPEGTTFDHTDRCENCDHALRRAGRKTKPKRKWKRPDKAFYRPRHKFQE